MCDKKVNYKMVKSTKVRLDGMFVDEDVSDPLVHLMNEYDRIKELLDKHLHFKKVFDEIVDNNRSNTIMGKTEQLSKDMLELHKYSRKV